MILYYKSLIFTLLFFSSFYLHAKDAPIHTWKKANISFAQYRQDSIECAKLGYFRDVSRDEPAKRVIRGSRSAEDALHDMNGPSLDRWRDANLRTQPERQLRELHGIQLNDVERCLVQKGYQKYFLTRNERKTLGRYPIGSAQRHEYLYRISSR